MTKHTTPRASFGSRLGFILAAAGSAIGLGTIWKFPYMVGAGGGGAFLLLYLVAVAGIGLAMMLAELALGRLSRTDAVGAFRSFGGGWVFLGYLSVLGAFCILSFYCVVGGWTVGYLVKALSGTLLSPSDGNFGAQFAQFAGSASASLLNFAVFMAMTAGVIVGGVREGIERTSKVIMPLLFLLMLGMVVRSVTLPGAWEGIRFFLVPDLSKITARVMTDALGFACFSLSLGFGAMLVYGSYMDKGTDMVRSAVWVVVLQTLCSILAGFMVLPAVFAFGLPPGQGPGLTYITLPAVFSAMPGGAFFGAVFFLLLLVAALTSSVSLLEPLVAFLIDQHRLRRKTACFLMAVGAFAMGVPSALSQGGAAVPHIFGWTFFDFMDFITSNIMLPVTVLATCLLMGWRARGAFTDALRPVGKSSKAREGFVRGIVFICGYVAPVVIAAILIASMV